MRTSQALEAGIHPRTLYAMRDTGTLEQVARGLYRMANGAATSNPDLVTVAAKIPSGVICLVSALAFHEITTQIPHEVHTALPRTARTPTLRSDEVLRHSQGLRKVDSGPACYWKKTGVSESSRRIESTNRMILCCRDMNRVEVR